MVTTALRHDRETLLLDFRRVRALTEQLAAPLSHEDQCVQSMADASPAKWHRAHTTWFFETFILVPEVAGYRPFDPHFSYLFNSYYEAVGERHARPERGVLTRPSCDEISQYRLHVDTAISELLAGATARLFATIAERIELGIHHEHQHQELLLMDIKHALSRNSFAGNYTPRRTAPSDAQASVVAPLEFTNHEGGIVDIGANDYEFAFDNELPMHTELIQPFQLASRVSTVSEWIAFIDDGGYSRPELWLSDGWYTAQRDGWNAPLYWQHDAELGKWTSFTLHGREAVRAADPVVHISHYEADAFARWSGARLPTESEWESAVSTTPDGHLLHETTPFEFSLHPTPCDTTSSQMFGDVWEWTASAYLAYPRFVAAPGAVGEYNGKFMSNQMVLRGGSFATPTSHIRPSYRNFFYPHQRWMFGGVRLARDVNP